MKRILATLALLVLIAIPVSAASHGGGGGGGGGGGSGGGSTSGGGTTSGGNGGGAQSAAGDGVSSVIGNAYDIVVTGVDGKLHKARLVFTRTKVTSEIISAAGAESLEFTEQKGKDDEPVTFDATGPGAKGAIVELAGKAAGEAISGELILTPKEGDKVKASFRGGKPGSDAALKVLADYEKAKR